MSSFYPKLKFCKFQLDWTWSQWHWCQANLFIFNCSPSHAQAPTRAYTLRFWMCSHFKRVSNLIHLNISNILLCFVGDVKGSENRIVENQYGWYLFMVGCDQPVNNVNVFVPVHSTVLCPLVWNVKTYYAKSVLDTFDEWCKIKNKHNNKTTTKLISHGTSA